MDNIQTPTIRVDNRARIVTITNQKGGTGKTTTTANLSAFFAGLGYKVLMIDGDSSASLSKIFLTDDVSKLPVSLPALIQEDLTLDHDPSNALSTASAIINVRPNLDILPSNLGLTKCETDIANRAALWVLRDVIAPVVADYDLIFVDTVPSLGHLQGMTLRATDEVLIPVNAAHLDTLGIADLLRTLTWAKRENPGIKHRGVVVNRVDTRTSVSQEVLDDIRNSGLEVLAMIRQATAIARAPGYKQTLFEFDPGNKANDDYRMLGARLMQKWAEETPAAPTSEVRYAR